MTVTTAPARIAIIGVSGYGRVHLQLAKESLARGEVQITAATIINPDEESTVVAELRATGTEIFADHAAMFRAHAGRIDLCLIPTGIHWHARMTIAALEAGANVLVEKPLAGSVAEVAEIRRAEQRTGRFVAVGFQDLYDPSTQWLQQELQRGVIGRIQSVRFLGLWPRPRSYFTRNNWAGRLRADAMPVMDSPLNNAFAHFVMLSLYFAGSETPVLEGVELFRAHAIESFDTAVVRSRTASGVQLWFGASHASHETIERDVRRRPAAAARLGRPHLPDRTRGPPYGADRIHPSPGRHRHRTGLAGDLGRRKWPGFGSARHPRAHRSLATGPRRRSVTGRHWFYPRAMNLATACLDRDCSDCLKRASIVSARSRGCCPDRPPCSTPTPVLSVSPSSLPGDNTDWDA
jgi:predicted dehydrogenase